MAGKANQYLSKALKFADRLTGRSANEWKMRSEVLDHATQNKITPERARRIAKVEAGRSFQTRAKTGIAAGTTIGAGFLGIHKYHQHKDNEIMRKINEMYGPEYQD